MHSQSKVKLIYNGVDLELFKNKPIDNVSYHKDKFIVAICGSINERKDVRTFIKAAELVCKTRSDVYFWIIGSKQGDYYQTLIDEFEMQPFFKHLSFLGQRDDVAELFQKIDILVSTSHYEPFGKTLVEAMAASKPVIATKSGGPQEIVVDTETGYLVEIGDFVEISKKITRIINNPVLRKQLGNKSKKRVLESFQLSVLVKQLESLFEKLLDRF